MSYMKICPMCNHSFHCMKMTAIYCGKKCQNRTRSLPRQLVEDMVKRSMSYMTSATKYAAMVTDKTTGELTTLGYIPEGASKENPLGKELNLLVGIATLEAQNRANRKRETLKDIRTIDQNNTYSDPEMKELHEILGQDDDKEDKEHEYVLNSTSGATLTTRTKVLTPPPESPLGFVVPITNENDLTLSNITTAVQEFNQQPKKYKIRRIGEKT